MGCIYKIINKILYGKRIIKFKMLILLLNTWAGIRTLEALRTIS